MKKAKPGSRTAAWKAGACALMLLLGTTASAAPGDPLGPAQPVHGLPNPSRTQVALDLARAASGVYAAVWNQGGATYARAFAANGQPRGPEIQVDPSTSYDGNGPRIVIDGGGRFLVAWSTENAVMGRHFAEDGAPMGPAFRLAVATPFGPVTNWDLAMASDGRYVLMIERTLDPLNTLTLHRFEADGRARLLLPAAVRVDEYFLWLEDPIPLDREMFASIYRNRTPPRLALDDKGEIALAWMAENVANYDRKYGLGPYWLYSGSILMRRIGAGGLPLGGTVKVASFSARQVKVPGYQQGPRIARSPDGRVAVAWMQPGEGLKLKRFTADLKPVGTEILVAGAALQERDFRVALAADGKAALTWTEAPASQPRQVLARLYSDTNQPLALVVEPGNATVAQERPRVAVDALGNFVLGWLTLLQPAGAPSEYAEVLRRYSGL